MDKLQTTNFDVRGLILTLVESDKGHIIKEYGEDRWGEVYVGLIEFERTDKLYLVNKTDVNDTVYVVKTDSYPEAKEVAKNLWEDFQIEN